MWPVKFLSSLWLLFLKQVLKMASHGLSHAKNRSFLPAGCLLNLPSMLCKPDSWVKALYANTGACACPRARACVHTHREPLHFILIKEINTSVERMAGSHGTALVEAEKGTEKGWKMQTCSFMWCWVFTGVLEAVNSACSLSGFLAFSQVEYLGRTSQDHPAGRWL